MDGNRQQGNNNRGNNLGWGMFQAFFGLIIAMVFAAFMMNMFSGNTSRLMSSQQTEISYSDFIQKVDNGEIYRVRISSEDIYAYKKADKATASDISVILKNSNNQNTNKALAEVLNSMMPQDIIYHVVKVSDDKELVSRLLEKGNIEIIGMKASVLVDILISISKHKKIFISSSNFNSFI